RAGARRPPPRPRRPPDDARPGDEPPLRARGFPPPAPALLATGGGATRAAPAEAEARLADLALPPPPAPPADSDPQGAFEVLTQACLKCHVRDGASLARVRAARPVLVHARFAHAPHLLQTHCARRHRGGRESQA